MRSRARPRTSAVARHPTSQPRVAASTMRVEIHPQRRAAEFRGSYRLENATAQAIDTLHIATSTGAGVETRHLHFDRPATAMLDDAVLGHRIYKLATPLRPGESMQLRYEVDFAPRGFGNGGADESVAANGSWLIALAYVPSIGYQPVRELREAGDRLTQGLPARPLVPKLEDIAARKGRPGDVGMQFEAIVGTAPTMSRSPGSCAAWREMSPLLPLQEQRPPRRGRAVLLGPYSCAASNAGRAMSHLPPPATTTSWSSRSACTRSVVWPLVRLRLLALQLVEVSNAARRASEPALWTTVRLCAAEPVDRGRSPRPVTRSRAESRLSGGRHRFRPLREAGLLAEHGPWSPRRW